MSELIKTINRFFKTAIKSDIERVESNIVLSERQKKVFKMFYIDRLNIDYIADSLGVCNMVVNSELKAIRQKMIKIL